MMKGTILFIYFLYFVLNLGLCDAWHLWRFWFHSEGCKLKLNKDLNHEHEPVFLVKGPNGPKLAMPQLIEDDGVFKLSKGEELIVACPGRQNEVRGIDANGSQSAVSKCVKANILHIQNKDIQSSDLDCKNRVFKTLKLSEKECGNYMGEEVELGFEVDGWHKLVTLCYYREHGETLYSTHMLYGSTLKGAEIEKRRLNFLRGPRKMFPNFSPENAYKQANQRLVLTRMLGERKANFMLARSYLSRGHLSPDADFLMGSWQHLTYFYVNTAPQWQSINGGNWGQVESFVRQFAINMKTDLVVTTGTYRILVLEDEDGYGQKLFLEPYQELLPVPEYFWKLVVDQQQKSCIVFFVYNNPFIETTPPIICPNVCNDHGWPSDLTDKFKGYVFCCTYQEFKEVVDYAPNEVCESILKMNISNI